MEHAGTQKILPLAFGAHHAAKDAPAKIVRQVESEAMALAVSMRSGGHKVEYIAACIGKSHTYVSRMRSGKRPIPHKLIRPLCAATGSNLLAQYIALQVALGEACDVTRLAMELRGVAA